MSPIQKPSSAKVSGIRAAVGMPQAAAAGSPAAAALQAEPSAPAVPAARDLQKQVRITVDLAADLHGFLRGFAQGRDAAAADVIRELIRQMRADQDLSARVTAELARRKEALAAAQRAARE